VADFTFWGFIASPYQLKMQSLVDFAECTWERWPDQGPRLAVAAMFLRLKKARKRESIRRYPAFTHGMDEYPTVPFYTRDRRHFFYDSTSLARDLDQHQYRHEVPLLPEQPGLAFICQLIDEAFDEFGLYMVHHNRWVTSASTNVMGAVTSAEAGKVLPFGVNKTMARKLPARQVRRCPYLFSVAPAGFDAGVNEALTPLARADFPATHDLLDTAWRQYLAAMEHILQQQPYLLGERFTLADASAYGQLSMNLIDGRAAELLEELAPVTYRWLCDIRDGRHIGSRGELFLSDALQPLLTVISETFVPLMQQNATAYTAALEGGETLFNEAAFDQDRALYDGVLQGHPFRSVAKSFQVVVWRDLCAAWHALPAADQQSLSEQYAPIDASLFG
jgi:hypothetical protein